MSDVEKSDVRNGKKTLSQESTEEWVTLEGGWGYVVCLGFSVIFTVTIAPMSSMGLLYNDFLEDLGEGTSGMTLVYGVSNAVVSFTGLLTTCALKSYTLRQVGLVGAFVYSFGSFVAIFVTSIPQFVFANGFIQGIGFGIMIPITLTTFNNYFKEKRVAMMSVASIIIGVGGMVFPMAVKVLMARYGFRGTLALMFALNLNVIPGMAVMHPVEWHPMPKIKKTKDAYSGKKTEEDNEITEILNCATDETEKDIKRCDENCIGENTANNTVKDPLLHQALNLKHPMGTNGSYQSLKMERKSSLNGAIRRNSRHHVINSLQTNLAKASSLLSLGNWTSNALATEAVPTKEGRWKVLIDFLDLSLLKDPIYTNICFGITMAFFSDTTFFTLEPMMLSSFGFTKSEVAYCITAGAAADLVSRAVFAIISFYVHLKSRHVIFIGNLFIIFFRIGFVQYTDFFSLLVLTACLGFFRNLLHVNIPLTFADYGPPSRFPAAYGLFMLVSGLLTLLLGPIIGYLRDLTNDYTLTLHTLTICSMLCTIPWATEILWVHLKERKNKMQLTSEHCK